jgi:anti-anti-sigma factor
VTGRDLQLQVVQLEPGGVQVSVAGFLDLATAPALSRSMLEYMQGGGRIVLDLSQLTFIDSSGLHALLGLAATASHSGASLLISRSLQPQVERVLEVSSALRLLPFART